MHDHHGGLGLNLLPVWGAMFWVPLLASVCALHVIHLCWMRGQARAFHAVHLLIGVGMVYMFAPWATMPLPAGWPVTFYCALTVVAVAWIGLELQSGRRVNLLWLLAAGECAAMAYMFAVHHGTAEIPALSRLLVGVYLLLLAAWTHGWFVETRAGARRSAVPYDLGPAGPPARTLYCSRRWDVAAAEAAMCLAMGYMFLGMDSGAREFFARAFRGGAVAEESLWAVSLIALAVLALIPVRRSATLPDQNTPQGHRLVARSGNGR
ncbi:MAG: DUF5134 domain-containing protein [Sporichthyaceae bacterium]